MRSRKSSFSLLGAPALLIALATGVMAGDPGRPPAGGEKARVAINLLRTPRGGATVRTMSMAPDALAAGQRVPTTVFVEGPGAQGCSARMTLEPPEAALKGFPADSQPVLWKVEVDVRSVSTDAIVLGVAWERLTRGPDGPRMVAGEAPRQVTLREAEHVLLDFVDRSPGGELPCAQSYAIEVTAELAEEAALAQKQIGYDLWLVHDVPGRRPVSERLAMTAMQGQESAYLFPHQDLPVRAGADGPETTLRVGVGGTLRGRLRPDGTLDVSLATRRDLWYVSPDGSGERVGDGGRKLLRLQPRETVRVELPTTSRNTEQPDRYARDLAGHRFALVLRARGL